MTTDQPVGGIATFVGRVRGQLDATDTAWVHDTSARLASLRAELGQAQLRLASAETTLAHPHVLDAAWPGPAGVDTPLAHHLTEVVIAVRGEQLVDELLTAGLLPAPPNATGTLVFGPDQAWDLELTAPGGGTLARADVLLTATGDELRNYLVERPAIDIVYTNTQAAIDLEASADPAHIVRPGDPWPDPISGSVVVDVGLTVDDLIAGVAEINPDNSSETSTESARVLLDSVPLLALAVIGARAARDSATTGQTGEDIAQRTSHDAKAVVTTAGLSHLVTTISGLTLLRAPLNLTFALSRSAVQEAGSAVALSLRRIQRVRRILAESAK